MQITSTINHFFNRQEQTTRPHVTSFHELYKSEEDKLISVKGVNTKGRTRERKIMSGRAWGWEVSKVKLNC